VGQINVNFIFLFTLMDFKANIRTHF